MNKFVTVILNEVKGHMLSKKRSYAMQRIIICFVICIAMLSGCQYNISGKHKNTTSYGNQYIPPEAPKQTNNEEQKPQEQGEQGVANPVKIALLVPLSGNYKELGQGMLNAAQLAVFRIGDASLTLVPIDTKDSPYGATEAAKKAVAEGAKIILGPVFSNSAKAVASVAAANNIQVVSFSNDKSLADSGVFAIGSMPEQQVRRIVNFAIAKGIKDFVTLLPMDAYGTIVTQELQQIAAAQPGISVLKNESYQTDAQGKPLSFDDHVKAAYDSAVSGVSASQRGVLAPANSSIAMQILGISAKYNFDRSKIQLLGNDQWNDPVLLSNPAFEGALFTDLPRERRRDFESKFKEVYGYDAPKLSGLAYDGIALAATIKRISGGGNFSREALINPRGFIGVDGIFRLQQNGLAERGYAIMSVKGGHAIVVDPAPTSF